MTLLILEDHRAPIIDIYAAIHTGSIYDPPEKVGLASIAAALMRSGGTKSFAPQEMDAKLDFVAASIQSWMDTEAGYASASLLTRDLDSVLPLFADMLENPAFTEERLGLIKKQRLDSITRQDDTPLWTWGRIFPQLVYGNSSVLARPATKESISRITREDLFRFHNIYYRPNNIILGISGDIKREEIIEKIKLSFGNWEQQNIRPGKTLIVERHKQAGLYLLHREGNQAALCVGGLGIKETDPDYFPAVVATHILGGGRSSRMFTELRTKAGLAYMASAGHTDGFRAPGYLYTYSETRVERTVQAMQVILQIIKELREVPVSDEELDSAKDAIINSFIFDYSSPQKVIEHAVSFHYAGLPDDFAANYRGNISRVTKDDIRRFAARYYDPDHAIILVIGDERVVGKPLSMVGNVEVLDRATWK